MSGKWLGVWTVLFALACVVSVASCLENGDDDDDDDDDAGGDDDDDSSGGGLCFWHCTWFDQVAYDQSNCLTVDSYEQCEDAAENCLDNPGGELHEGVYDPNCSTCSDSSCWPDWYNN